MILSILVVILFQELQTLCLILLDQSSPGWKEFVLKSESSLPQSFGCLINFFHPVLLNTKAT
jgi:hypothetical protein